MGFLTFNTTGTPVVVFIAVEMTLPFSLRLTLNCCPFLKFVISGVTIKELLSTSGKTLTRSKYDCGRASSHTVCQIPVVRV